jgi:N-hydroxyarylamine O-acetyltransferase
MNAIETISPSVPVDHLQPDVLQAYFRRIGYTGEKTPTLATLEAIHFLHPQAIPFENLNPFMRWPVRLDIQSLQEKLLIEGRGGYCFEHNLLLSRVLKTLGFRVRGLAARVLWNVPEGIQTARGHMLLLVELEGERFIADVGFGGLTLTAPLRLEANTEQVTPHEPFRLREEGEEYLLEAQVKSEWKPLYRFSLQEQLLRDYEVTSWYLSNHPSSHFVMGIIAARTTPEGRYTLRNLEMAFHDRSGQTIKNTVSSARQLRETLENVFQIRISAAAEVEAALQQLIDQVKPTPPAE